MEHTNDIAKKAEQAKTGLEALVELYNIRSEDARAAFMVSAIAFAGSGVLDEMVEAVVHVGIAAGIDTQSKNLEGIGKGLLNRGVYANAAR